MLLPKEGTSREGVMSSLREARANDVRWRDGRVFSLVYWCGDDVLGLLKEAAMELFCENALNPTAFPSLRRFETEVLQMVAGLLGHPEAAGTMTSGGTESILMAVKTARDFARKSRQIARPNVVLPSTAHPAFDKAGAYFDVEMRHAPVDAALRVDLGAVEAMIDDQTIMLVGSAPAYPHGVIDPIAELGAIAERRGLLMHVDGCVGGMLLPFLERLGHPLPPFDFRVAGVTSMSTDLHKYGWAAKGASVVLYRTRALRQHQFVVYPDWPGGLYGSPSMPGTRPGGPIAAAWAVMRHLGEEGYLRHARTTLETSRRLIDGVRAIPGLFVFGEPHMSVFAVGSTELDIYAVGDRMQGRGWLLDRQQRPPSLHLTVTPVHAPHVDAILADLRASADEVRAAGAAAAAGGAAAMYGMLGTLPDRGQVGDFVREFLDGLDRV